MKVLIFPTDDRSGQASIIHHYAKLGHEVFIPKFGTPGFKWSHIALWPALLTKSTEDPTKRNIELHNHFDDNVQYFGEDHFLRDGQHGQLYDDKITCQFIDIEKDCPSIDVFHSLRGAQNYLGDYLQMAKKYFPKAKWVSSTMSAWDHCPGGYRPKNVAKLIPANYENQLTDRNNISLFCCDFELKLLGISLDGVVDRSGFASYQHNFKDRQPTEFQLFTKMNQLLIQNNVKPVPNYGGNIRTQGADIRYSQDKGLTGNYQTLSPRDAIEMMRNLKAIIHFKQNDWGGGVFYHALNTGTPIITTPTYIDASNSRNYLIDGFNSIYVDTPESAAEMIMKIDLDDIESRQFCWNMKQIKKQIFSEDYWNNWRAFLEKLC